jgi:hypothetical protein
MWGHIVRSKALTSHWLRRIVVIVVVVEVSWLVLVNAALQLPLTQKVINSIRPDKFQVSWQKAWSWYPARFEVKGVFANGQSRTQQWQVEAPFAAGSVSLLPLILKRVWVRDVVARDVEYRQRPRLTQNRDLSDVIPYFPDIEGWEMTDAVTTPRKKRSWRVAVDDIQLSGNHTYWIWNIQGQGHGYINGSLTYDTRERVFSLDAHELDLELDAPLLSGKYELFRRGEIRGSLALMPFAPSEHNDISLMRFLKLDADTKVDVNSLAFVNLFTLDYQDVTVDGRGRVEGRLRLDQGFVLPGTDLVIDASDLTVGLLDHRISGIGQVELRLGPETGNQLDLGFHYRDLVVTQAGEPGSFMTGSRLDLSIGGDGRLLPDPDQMNESRSIAFDIEQLTVPDLRSFQRYLPPKWPMTLHGGDGVLRGSARLTPTALSVDLSLQSDRADVGFEQYRFECNLDAALRLDNPSILTGPTAVAGSHIRLSDSVLLNEDLSDAQPWGAALEIESGHFSLFRGNLKSGQADVIDLFQVLAKSQAKDLLGNSSAILGLQAEVSSLAWIAALLGGEYNTAVSGSSTIGGDLMLDAGMPAVGTQIDIESRDLAVRFLDYIGKGQGVIAFDVKQGGTDADWLLAIDLADAEIRRQDEPEPFLKKAEMSLRAELEDMDFEQQPKEYSLAYTVRSARVEDMSAFNTLLPPDSPVRFTGGAADLTADILLHPHDAEGWLRLTSKELQAEADRQSVTADLSANLALAGGVPSELRFDIRGSVVDLTRVRVSGDSDSFDADEWSAQLVLTRGDTTLTKPHRMDLEAQLRMSDSRPFVAMFQNQDGWRPDFLARLVTVEDIEGTAQLLIADERAVIPYADATSDNIEVGAKGVIAETGNDGVIYLKYKKADALLKIHAGKKRVDLFRPRKKFDEYRAH